MSGGCCTARALAGQGQELHPNAPKRSRDPIRSVEAAGVVARLSRTPQSVAGWHAAILDRDGIKKASSAAQDHAGIAVEAHRPTDCAPVGGAPCAVRALCEKSAVFHPPVATGPRVLNSAPPMLF